MLLLSSAVAASAETRVSGTVHDPSGRPVPAAIVTLRGGGLEVKAPTDTEGRWSASWNGPDEVAVTVDAPGFAERRRTVHLVEHADGLRIEVARVAFGEEVTVTAAGREDRLGESPASVVVLSAGELAATAAPVLDDALRQVPGFTLFRRTGSRTANPTTQGFTLRGLGGSGASRGVVLDDGVPLNDPFGGWVYWGRVPHTTVERVEVLRGGASHHYGSGGVAGVVQVVRRMGSERRLDVEAAAGTQRTVQGSVFGQAAQDAFVIRLAMDFHSTGGYLALDPVLRGPVDDEVRSQWLTEEVTLEYGWSGGARVFLRGNVYSETRGNGTVLQRNESEVKLGVLGADVPQERGALSLRATLADQYYEQTFTSVAASRSTETVTREQAVPAGSSALLLRWTRSFGGSRSLLLGLERARVHGRSNETVFSGTPPGQSFVEGEQRTLGAFGDHTWGLGRRAMLTVGARFDRWTSGDAQRVSGSATTRLQDRTEQAISPRGSLMVRLGSHLSVTGSSYRGFRAPTLNELYRPFQVGDVFTAANERLERERMSGVETGMLVAAGPFSLRATAFRMRMEDMIANVTLSTQPGLILRERQNLGAIRSQGIEAEADVRAGRHVAFSGAYLFAESTVRSFAADPTLVGNRLPQVPRHHLTAQARYADRGRIVALQARAVGRQFDDDRNTLRLSRARTIDVLVTLPIGSASVFAAGENLLGATYEVAKTPLRTLGPGRTVRVGLRLALMRAPAEAKGAAR